MSGLLSAWFRFDDYLDREYHGMPNSLEDAIALAAKHHAGQVDKAGRPYILHSLRVMLQQDNDHARIAAVLHDVVEDTPITLEDLRDMGFDHAVIEAVDILTRDESTEDYDLYLERVSSNPIACQVKLADLQDNMDWDRISEPTERDHARVEKYRRAHRYLSGSVDD